MDAVSEGDLARFAGDRPAARRHYREAIDSGEPEAVAMAHLRMLHFSGNLGLMVHGPRAEELLFTAEPTSWLTLAWADYHLLAPPQVGANPNEAIRLAEVARRSLPGPSMARLYLATGDRAWLEEMEGRDDLDGLGRALLESDGAPAPNPGTWFLSFGVAGAPGAGFGGGITWIHPDFLLRGYRLTTGIAATTKGTYGASLSVRTPGTIYGTAGLGASNTVRDLYDAEGNRSLYRHERFVATGGLGMPVFETDLAVGFEGRFDRVEGEIYRGLGPWGSVTWNRATGWGGDRRGWRLSARGEGIQTEYDHLLYRLDARGYVGFLKGVTAGRATWAHAPLETSPFFLLPTAGGAELHRGAWDSRYRADVIATLDLEQRWMVAGPLEGVVFADAAWVIDDGWHPGAGLGIRLILPPEAVNTVRFDVAVSDSNWGIYTGFGETF